MIKYLFTILFLISLTSCAEASRPNFPMGKVEINNKHIINVEIATTPEQQSYGLMNIKNIPHDQGMVFISPKEKNFTMWMKNTYIPLDMFFINKDGIITHIEKNTKPLSLKHITSNNLNKYILETNAGVADKLKISIGEKIKFINF